MLSKLVTLSDFFTLGTLPFIQCWGHNHISVGFSHFYIQLNGQHQSFTWKRGSDPASWPGYGGNLSVRVTNGALFSQHGCSLCSGHPACKWFSLFLLKLWAIKIQSYTIVTLYFVYFPHLSMSYISIFILQLCLITKQWHQVLFL